MDKEGRLELAKIFARFAEITFAVMVASPAALFVVRGEIPWVKLLVSLGLGFAVILTLVVVVVTLLKKR
ncbi:MAG: hypothetical protein HYY13_07030 [Nitrospirae bacterium]|nr:hypothetical protein [Nitrospirota bacterium]